MSEVVTVLVAGILTLEPALAAAGVAISEASKEAATSDPTSDRDRTREER
jgi:hypothetical protein